MIGHSRPKHNSFLAALLRRHAANSTHLAACALAFLPWTYGCSITDTEAKPAGTGAGTILTFTDITRTTQQNSGTAEELNAVTFGGKDVDAGLFVAVGAAGTIVTSPDGIHWTPQVSPTPLDLYGVTYGNNQFIVVGGNDVAAAGVVLTGLPDGITWTVEEDVSGMLSSALTSVGYAKGQFVAVGNNQVLSSADGHDWNSLPSQPSGITGPTVDLFAIAYGYKQFVTVGTYNETTSSQEIAYRGFIATSPDAVNWSIQPYPPNYLSGIVYGDNQFVAVGREGSILTSPDGTTWTAQSAPQLDIGLTPYLISVTYGGGQFVATGNYVGTSPSTGVLLASPDGTTWTTKATGSNLYGVAYGVVAGAGTFVTVGGEGGE